MPSPTAIEGILPDEQDLLEAAGWADPKVLASADAGRVRTELEKANSVLKLSDEVPAVERIQGWIDWASTATGIAPTSGASGGEEVLEIGDIVEDREPEDDGPLSEPSGPVNYEADPDVQAMIRRAPVAIPVENRVLAERGIAPSEISIAPVLNHAESDLEIRVTATPRRQAAPAASGPRRRNAGVVTVADGQAGARRGIDTSRVRSLDDMKDGGAPPVPAPAPVTSEEPINLLRTPRESTNRGKKPSSKFFIRGVLHDRPLKVWFGCAIAVLFQLLIPFGVIAAPLLILSDQMPEKFGWVPKWFLAFPLAVPVLGLLYFLVGTGVKCRVCGQKILVPRHCRKNVKAHHVRGLGYILPTAVHTILFRWFNCTFCGTSVRIKE